MRVSVIVPAASDEVTVRRLMLHLEAQTYPDFEVIVVDEASRVPLGVADIRFESRVGAYAARNAGIRRATGEVIAFTDADCAPDRGWIAAGLAALRTASRAAGRVELVGGRSLPERLDRQRFLRQERYVDEGFGATANLFVKRSVFDDVGLFDERLLSGGDAEHGRRCEAAGHGIAYAPDALVRHPCRTSAWALIGKAHRVGIGFGQTVRLHGLRGSAPGRASDRLGRHGNLVEATAMLVLHGATVAGALRGYLAGKVALR